MKNLSNDSVDKSDVRRWETVASYVATFPADGGEGATDVSVAVGEAGGVWFLRTSDDAGGGDDAPDTAYSSKEEAVAAAEALAAELDEGDGETAAEYLDAQRDAMVGDPDPDGEWAVYWETVGDDERVVERYGTYDQAAAAAERAQEQLEARHPGGRLLCGYAVRHLDAEQDAWVACEEVES